MIIVRSKQIVVLKICLQIKHSHYVCLSSKLAHIIYNTIKQRSYFRESPVWLYDKIKNLIMCKGPIDLF